jgi:zinc protease
VLGRWSAIGDWRLFFLHRDRAEGVTLDAVREVADSYLLPTNRTTALFAVVERPRFAEIPPPGDVEAMVEGYRGRSRQAVTGAATVPPSVEAIEVVMHRFALPNEMRVTLLPTRMPGARVEARLILRHGSADALQGKRALAQITGAMLSHGQSGLADPAIQDSLRRLRAYATLSVSPDAIAIRIEADGRTLPDVIALVAHGLKRPVLSEEDLQNLRRSRVGRLEAARNDVEVRMNRALHRHFAPLPPGHPLGMPEIDEEIVHIEAITIEDVRTFHSDLIGATGGDLVVVGDFALEPVSEAARQNLGDWQSRQPYERLAREYFPTTAKTEHVTTSGSGNAFVAAGFAVRLSDEQPDYLAVELAQRLLRSRLERRLRGDEGVSYMVATAFSMSAADSAGRFRASASFAPANGPAAMFAFKDEIDLVQRHGFTEEEVEAAKASWLGEWASQLAQPARLAPLLAERSEQARTLWFDEVQANMLRGLTASVVNDAVRRHLTPEAMVLLIVGDLLQ